MARNTLPSTAPALLSTAALARLLDVHPDSIRRWRMLQIGPPYVKLNRTIRYRLSDVSEWIASNAEQELAEGPQPVCFE